MSGEGGTSAGEYSAWAEMDAWCAARTEALQGRVSHLILHNKVELDDPELRHLVGQSDAFHRMRSFIHGARNILTSEAVR